jgi:hypothetical protein
MSESKPHPLSIWLSSIAIIVSLGAVVIPLVIPLVTNDAVAKRYVGALVKTTVSEAEVAVGAAEPGSAADDYATGISWILQAYADSNGGTGSVSAGRADGRFGTYDVCFPRLSVYAAHRCVMLSDFEFNEHQRITRFTVDDLAVESIVRTEDYDKALSDGSNHDWRAYRTFALFDTKRAAKIEVLWIDRGVDGGNAATDPMPLRADLYQDMFEKPVTAAVTLLPDEIPKRGNLYGVIRVPTSTTYMLLCGSGPIADDQAPCHWVDRL